MREGNTCLARLEEPLPFFAVKVRSKGEENVASALRNKRYTVLSPTYVEIRRYSDRTRRVSCSLFPGYLFVQINPSRFLDVVSTDGVSYVVRTGTELEPLSESEVRAIELLCSVGKDETQSLAPCDYLRIGQRVRIEAGPLAGLEGVLMRTKDKDRVVVTVESLHSSISVEVGSHRISVLTEPMTPDNRGQLTLAR